MSDEKIYQLALHLTNGLGSVLIRQLIAHFGSAQKIFQANLKSLTRVNGIGEATARIILQKKGLNEAEEELKKLETTCGQLLFYTDPEFPSRFKSLYDAPVLIYGKGNFNLNEG